ncbi:MAG: bifunctional phosphoribosylaminoimidazolecarboxamide formyltransferase/IMP cyclohydrolase [Planctomycetota bacterium]|nr:bifunctional phosphoribosylaminoimidazolecarboxamide formyltransferase/IMP cyclohydrolase [Planctomycetota bacterium]
MAAHSTTTLTGAPPFIPIRRALISVSDKTGLVDFARQLVAAKVELFSTGGTRRSLEEAGLAVRDVGEYTGFPEMLDGRVKTLHPKVHGGILCRHELPEDMAALKQHGILTFELVVVNLYPFEQTIQRAGVTDAEAIEQIDIGGPSLVRGAAKNHRYVTVITSADQYATVQAEIQANGGTSIETRRKLAGAAYSSTASYDTAIAAYFARSAAKAESQTPAVTTNAQPTDNQFEPQVQLALQLRESLRYGENPHQPAALYVRPNAPSAALVNAAQLNGKELSYNNWLDLDAAWSMARSLAGPAAVIIKHNNPCGAATDSSLSVAMRSALDGDPVSAFGSVIGINRAVDAATAEVLCEPDRFVEAIVAPGYNPDALQILKTKPKWKANVRLMQVEGGTGIGDSSLVYRQINGGFLVQAEDSAADLESDWTVVTEVQPTAEQLDELRFAWSMVRHVKSNAILLSKKCALVGVGAGQMSRVDSVEIAIRKAGPRSVGSVLASDAFFPFGDSIPIAAQAGVVAVIQPGGSRRDAEVIAACNMHKIPMIFTARRHFKH